MATIIQTFNLDLLPCRQPPDVPVTQYDEGEERILRPYLYKDGKEFNVPNGSTVTVSGTNTAGGGFKDLPCTFEWNHVDVPLTEAMTAVQGPVRCKLTISKTGLRIGTCAFVLQVDKDGVTAEDIAESPGFADQLQSCVDDYIDGHPQIFEGVDMFRGSITGGALSSKTENGWYLISTAARPNISDVPPGANNICFLINRKHNGGVWQEFCTVFGQRWYRYISSSVGAWHEEGFSSSVSASYDAFKAAINRKAALLGMAHTQYDTVAGLNNDADKNLTTANDTLRLAVAAYQSEACRRYGAVASATIYKTVSGTETALTLSNAHSSLFAALKTAGFTPVIIKSGSQQVDTDPESDDDPLDVVKHMVAVCSDDTTRDVFAVAVMDCDSQAAVYRAVPAAFAALRSYASTGSAPAAQPGYDSQETDNAKAVAGCRILSNAETVGVDFENVDCHFCFEISTDYQVNGASIGKVMALLIAGETFGNWHEMYRVSDVQGRIGGSGKNLHGGDELTLEDLALDAMMRSSNRAKACLCAAAGGRMLYRGYSGR